MDASVLFGQATDLCSFLEVIDSLGYQLATLPLALTCAALGKDQKAELHALSLLGANPMTAPNSVANFSVFLILVFSCFAS